METVGSLIRNAREQQGLTVKELIKRLHGEVSPAYITKIEIKREIPSPSLLFKFCELLNIDLEMAVDRAKRQKLEEYKYALDDKYNAARSKKNGQ